MTLPFSFYSVLFDKSLNSSLQQCQMDIHIRFWDEFKSEVTTQYLTSEILEHLLETVKPWSACSHQRFGINLRLHTTVLGIKL